MCDLIAFYHRVDKAWPVEDLPYGVRSDLHDAIVATVVQRRPSRHLDIMPGIPRISLFYLFLTDNVAAMLHKWLWTDIVYTLDWIFVCFCRTIPSSLDRSADGTEILPLPLALTLIYSYSSF